MQSIDENEFKRNIAQKIKFYRKETQEKTAENASISVDTLSTAERGISIINSLNLVNLSNALNVTPNDILADFIADKNKLLTSKLNNDFDDLSIEEKNFLLSEINFIKSHRNSIC